MLLRDVIASLAGQVFRQVVVVEIVTSQNVIYIMSVCLVYIYINKLAIQLIVSCRRRNC